MKRMNSMKPLKTHVKPILNALRYIAIYVLWISGVQLLYLTVITFFTASPTSRLQDISEVLSSNEITLMGMISLLFALLLYSPGRSKPFKEFLTRERIEKNLLPGFVQGAFFAGAMILAFVLSGTYSYWGFFIQMDEAPMELFSVFLRITAIGALVFSEEYIFRHRIPQHLNKVFRPIITANVVAVLYCCIKMLQFHLEIAQIITLYLASIALSCRTERDGQFARAAGFWAAILIVFQPLLSLPIFGNDFSGILLIKSQALVDSTHPESSSTLSQLFSGGAEGPLASFTFQLLLILDITRSVVRPKRNELIGL